MYNNFLLAIALAGLLTACAGLESASFHPWTELFDGSDLDQWNTTGDANWHINNDAVQADKGAGMLVSKQSYRDFSIQLEFWADPNSNSGVFIRCSDPAEISPATCYEVNIFDTRPDQTYRTGSIVDVSPPRTVIDTEGRWNTYEITAEGTHLVIRLNGTVTVDTHDDRQRQGPFALQYGAGGIKFRNIRIRPL